MVLFIILKKNFFEKVHNFVIARETAIKDSFSNAELTNKQADERLEEYNKRILNSESEAREIVKNAKIKADAQAREIIENANKQASRIITQAELEIERDRATALSEVRHEIGALALLAAEKILERQIEVEGQSEIIDKIIEQAGTSQWQN
jgi:F-type H+-transporting ATPase subunit b